MGHTKAQEESTGNAEGNCPLTPRTRSTSSHESASGHLLPANEENGDTVRRRRGFRPLSVFTNSVFFPFDLETNKAMETLHRQRSQQASNQPDNSANRGTVDLATHLSPTDTFSTSVASVRSGNSFSGFVSSVGTSVSGGIKCSYPGLMFLPAPDPSQHPAFSDDPFASVSDSPLLISTSTAEEIRKLVSRPPDSQYSSFGTSTSPSFGVSFGASNRSSESSSDFSPGAEKGRLIIPDYIRTPDPILGKRGFSARMHGSPLAGRFQEIVIPTHVEGLNDSDETERRRVTSGSLRKLSDLFKSRIGNEKTFASSPSPASGAVDFTSSGSAPRAILEEKLRKCTYSPTYTYQTNSVFPRHPNTGKSWKSRNLKCTTCSDESCHLCGRACCAFRASVMALETHKANPEGRALALQRVQEITMVYPYGQEVPTFLHCNGASGIGCGRIVCPDCCGQCPDATCKDIQCYKCKQEPWDLCEWHADLSALPMPTTEAFQDNSANGEINNQMTNKFVG